MDGWVRTRMHSYVYACSTGVVFPGFLVREGTIEKGRGGEGRIGRVVWYADVAG